MRRIFLASVLCAAALFAVSAVARTIVDGNLQVTPTKDGKKYVVDGDILGKPEFFGDVGDFVEHKKITGVTLLHGEYASDEQKHVVAITAKTQKIDAFIDMDGKVQPLIDPVPPPAPAVTPAPVAPPPAAAPTEGSTPQ